MKIIDKIYSFDIFDTLITRMVAKPSDIFVLMQFQLQHNDNYDYVPNFIKNNFACIREEIELFLRTNLNITKKRNDISIKDIYNAIQNNYSLSKEQMQVLLKLELETEKKNLYPITKNINKIKELKKNGEKVILISDMYLTQDMLRDILVNIDDVFKDIEIYVSNEFNCSKYDGNLYKCVKEKLGLSDCHWEHYGDNKYADVKKSKRQGINGYLYKFESLQNYEKYAIKNTNKDINIESIIGIARYTRLCNQKPSEVYNLGCSFAAPILYGYVNWIIEESIKKQTKTLYFIARDGYVLKEIADVIIQNKNLNIQTKYIYGSRKAWRMPTSTNIDSFINWIFNEYSSKLSSKYIAEKLNINSDILEKYIGTIPKKINRRKSVQKDILNKILKNEELKQLIIDNNKIRKELLIKYLKQEINFNENEINFVDLNGSGRTQDSLSDLISKEIKDVKIKTYYFHFEFNKENHDKSQKLSYFSSYNYRSVILEVLCRTTQGQTIGYKENDEKIIPIFDKFNNSKNNSDKFILYLTGIKDFVKNLLVFNEKNFLSIDTLSIYLCYTLFLLNDIDKKTADIIGSIYYSQTGTEENVKDCAKKMNIFDLTKYFLTGKINSEFDFISIARSGILAKYIKKFIDKFGSFRKFLINIYINKSKMIAYIRIFGIKISLINFIERGV